MKASPTERARAGGGAGRPAPPSLGPTLDFLRVLWELDHALQRRSKRMGRELGLTGPQRLVLRIVGRFPGIPAGELAELLSLHPSTLTGILQRLETRGWLRRRPHPRDRRRALLGLTGRGRELDALDPHAIEGAVRRVRESMSSAERAGADKLLRALARELEGAGDG
jgi:DNA-binding MarR family transcriptional regulator